MLFNNYPCKQRIGLQNVPWIAPVGPAQNIAGYSVNGTPTVPAPVMNQSAVPYCDQVSIVDEIIWELQQNPVLALGVAAAIYFLFFKKK